MTSEQWQKVKGLFDAALALAPAKRDKFLKNACSADDELRREVENLLASFDNAESFLDKPAAAEVASLIVEKNAKFKSGERIAHYEISHQIGEGGMGEVYLAKDTRLSRKVALKILPANLTSDQSRLLRFKQEAQAASNLNHPNIITIYEIREYDGTHLIATEFVEGETLRQKLSNENPKINEIFEIVIQLVSALSVAHSAGVIHRDIKPENIMIRPDGIVKLLDFGLAKLTEDRHEEDETLIPASSHLRVAASLTNPGMVMGTVNYMSPEQAQGAKVDRRTDLWSLGVLLYEMLAGKQPFSGKTVNHTLVAIMEQKPESFSENNPAVSPEMEEAVFKLLEKEPKNRYQTADELLADLRQLQTRISQKVQSGEMTAAFAGKAKTEKSENQTAADESEKNKTFIQVQKTGDRNSKTAETARRKFAWYYAVPGLLILFLTGGAVWFYLNGGSFGINNFLAKKPALSLQTMKINRLSDTSQAVAAAVSPDGEFIVFVKEENGKQSLWLRQVSAPSSVKIAQPADDEIYGSPAFSPDGSHIFYLKVKSNKVRATLYQIPKLGGSEKKMVEDVSLQDSGSNFSLSPDGRRAAFIRLDEGFNRSLVVTDLSGANERKLLSRRVPDFLTGAAFSPDGKQIAVISGTFGGKSGGIGGSKNIVLVSAEDAAEKLLSEKSWAHVEGLKWLDDGSGLIVSAGEKPSLVQLWHIAVSGGEPSRITNDLSDYAAPSLTADSKMIAAVQTNQNSNIWIYSPNSKETSEKQMTFGNGSKDGIYGVSFAPDGGIVYVSQINGNPDIWIVNADGSENRQLTKDAGINLFPAVSPDGKYVVFLSDRSGEGAIWRMDIDGGSPVQLAKGAMPSFTPDGKWIYFYGAGAPGLWKIPVAGGTPVQIPVREKDVATTPVVSPDNTMLACNYLVGERGAQFRLGILPVEGGEPLRIFDTFTYAIKPLRWTADSRAVGFIETREGVSNIFKHSLDSEKAESITNFKTGTIWNFDWSGDGKKLALSRGSISRDVVLISDFK